MTKAEKKILDFILKKKNQVLLLAVLIFAILVRYAGRDFASGDMLWALRLWFEEIQNNGGLKSLSTQVGDYGLLYQTIIALFTYTKVNSIYLYKLLSVLFDFALAFLCAAEISKEKKEKTGSLFYIYVLTVILFLPTVIMNSAYWGQCDVIYTFFVMGAFFCLYREKYVPSFLLLGIAFAFKLQTIFILPVFLCAYARRKNFSIFMFGLSVVTFWVSGIAGFLEGRSILSPFGIYQNQVSEYHTMYMNINSFWCLIGGDGYYKYLNKYALFLAIFICGLGFFMVITEKKNINSMEKMMNTAAWFAWTMVFFLPSMHDRYSYIPDLMLILLCFFNLKYLKYALVCVLSSTITYTSYLFHTDPLERWHTILYLLFWLHFSWTLLKEKQMESESDQVIITPEVMEKGTEEV